MMLSVSSESIILSAGSAESMMLLPAERTKGKLFVLVSDVAVLGVLVIILVALSKGLVVVVFTNGILIVVVANVLRLSIF